MNVAIKQLHGQAKFVFGKAFQSLLEKQPSSQSYSETEVASSAAKNSVVSLNDPKVKEIADQIEQVIKSRRVPFIFTSADDSDALQTLRLWVTLLSLKRPQGLDTPIHVVLPPVKETPFQCWKDIDKFKDQICELKDQAESIGFNVDIVELDENGNPKEMNIQDFPLTSGLSFFAGDFPKSIKEIDFFRDNLLNEHALQVRSRSLKVPRPVNIEADHHPKSRLDNRIEQVHDFSINNNDLWEDETNAPTGIVFNPGKAPSAAFGLTYLMLQTDWENSELDRLTIFNRFLAELHLGTLTDIAFHNFDDVQALINDPVHSAISKKLTDCLQTIRELGMGEFAGFSGLQSVSDTETKKVEEQNRQMLQIMDERIKELGEVDELAKTYIYLLDNPPLFKKYKDRLIEHDFSVLKEEDLIDHFQKFQKGLRAEIQNIVDKSKQIETIDGSSTKLCYLNPKGTQYLQSLVDALQNMSVRNIKMILREELNTVLNGESFLMALPVPDEEGYERILLISHGEENSHKVLQKILEECARRIKSDGGEGDAYLKPNSGFGSGDMRLKNVRFNEIIDYLTTPQQTKPVIKWPNPHYEGELSFYPIAS